MLQSLFALILATLAQASAAPATPREPTIYDYRVVATYPHDREAFTQGLVYLDGEMLESTGRTGTSFVRRVRFEDGHVLRQAAIPPSQFGEGIVNWGDQIVSITWTNGIGYRWNRRTLERLGEWRYSGEGWGLTQNGADIIMSDGTNQLRFLDPATLTERRRVAVTIRGRPLNRLNELEWVNGEVFANVWTTPYIVRIDPASGEVTGVIDLTVLSSENNVGDDSVLNGIAYDSTRDRLFVTGKLWQHLYEIDLVPRPAG